MNILPINNLLNLSLYLFSASILIFVSAVIYKYSNWYSQIRDLKNIRSVKKRLHFIGRFCIALFSLALILFSLGYYLNKYYLFDLFSPFLFIIGLSIFGWNINYKHKGFTTSNNNNLEKTLSQEQGQKNKKNDQEFIDNYIKNQIIYEELKDSKNIQFIVEMIYRRYKFHLVNAEISCNFYRNKAKFFTYIIPIYSAILTFILTTKFNPDIFNISITSEYSNFFLSLIGLGLTILTIINSYLSPLEKALQSSNILIELEEWIMIFISGIISHIRKNGHIEREQELIKFLHEQDEKMTKIGKKLLDIDTPGGKSRSDY